MLNYSKLNISARSLYQKNMHFVNILEELFVKNYYSFNYIAIFARNTLGHGGVLLMVRSCHSTVINKYKMVEAHGS